jgi:ABC-type Zn uptake system ZnuABC Zn-binding protein ZnuA
MRRFISILCSCVALLTVAGVAAAKPLRVVATVPCLGALAEEVGGDEVDVAVLVKGPQDAHFIEPRPSFVRKLHKANLYMQIGMELEIGWAPVLLRQARNAKIQPGAQGHLDASMAISPLEVPLVPIDRTAGDVHPFGNPHYLTDPLNGLRVAALIRDRLTTIRPESAGVFRQRYAAFEQRLISRLVGADLVERHGARALVQLVDSGSLGVFLREKGEETLLGGWLGQVRSVAGTRAVQDHRIWVYFARHFGLRLVGELEPKPGISPTTRHLSQLVERMRVEDVRVVLSSPYFDPRHARWVAERTDAKVAEMAHQVGARPGTDDYLAMVDYNVRQLVEAL